MSQYLTERFPQTINNFTMFCHGRRRTPLSG
jgi:hypothetical protein